MQDEEVLPIAWMEVLETGIPELDDDHRALVEQCNVLALLMADGTWPEVVEAARRLTEQCTEHFREEEALLDRTEFPRRERHKMQHRDMERRFAELIAFLSSVDGSSPEHRGAAQAVRMALVEVLFRHDLDYKSHLQHVSGR